MFGVPNETVLVPSTKEDLGPSIVLMQLYLSQSSGTHSMKVSTPRCTAVEHFQPENEAVNMVQH